MHVVFLLVGYSPPSWVHFGKKIECATVKKKTLTNYMSKESLINVVYMYYKNKTLVMFSFRKCKEVVRCEMTKGSSIEFIWYQIPQYE